MATIECPRLNNMTENPGILTIFNLNQPRLSTYERTVGTAVRLTCASNQLQLTPSIPILSCRANGNWDREIPTCQSPSAVSTPSADGTGNVNSGLTEEQQLIIGITGGIGGFIFIILVVLIVAICYMQHRARKRQADKDRYRGRNGTEVTSVASFYPMDSGSYGPDRSFSPYPSLYPPRDRYPDGDRRKLSPMALPPVSPEYDAYNNPAFRHDVDDLDVTPYRNRDDLLDVIARERMEQLKYDQDRLQTDYTTGQGSRAKGKRYDKRRSRSPEAVVRAQRTQQYVQEHSPVPSYPDQNPFPTAQGRGVRGHGRYDDRPGRYQEEYRSLDRYRDDHDRGFQSHPLEPQRYHSNPRDGGQLSRDARGPPRDYPPLGDPRGYDPRGYDPQSHGYDTMEASRYGPGQFPELGRDARHWRPQTKTHYTGNRHR